MKKSLILLLAVLLTLSGCGGRQSAGTGGGEPAPATDTQPASSGAPFEPVTPDGSVQSSPSDALPASSGAPFVPDGADGGTVSEDRAVEIALSHAGVSADMVTGLRTERDNRRGRETYDIEFYRGAAEYEYEIDRNTGEILSYQYDVEGTAASGTDSAAPSDNGAGISETDAVAIALRHAGQDADSVSGLRWERDRENGRAVYEVSFYVGPVEYDYHIAASDGEILSVETEND